MEINPKRVRTAEFRTVKRGLDPEEVQAFLHAVADELERAQNQSTAMEARARAAVARLQELSEEADSQSASGGVSVATPAATTLAATPVEGVAVAASVDQSETISRTLLLAQRTADTTVAEARAEAERLRAKAEAEANQQIGNSREMSETLLNEARIEARKVGQEERVAMEGEVNSLSARRDFLESDVDHLEQFLVDQRTRLRDAAAQIVEITERVPSGLGETRRPLISGAGAGDGGTDDDTNDHTGDSTDSDSGTDDNTGTATHIVTDVNTGTHTFDEGPQEGQEDLWLPDAVDDGPPAGNPSDNR